MHHPRAHHPNEESSKLQSWARSLKFAVFRASVKLIVFESVCERERGEEKRREEVDAFALRLL
jgi:hypothetical protein